MPVCDKIWTKKRISAISQTKYHKKVKFRHLSHEQIDSYLAWDKPYSSTGGFKAESKGIALFEEITSKDPTALMGLPLIDLVSILTKLKIYILK